MDLNIHGMARRSGKQYHHGDLRRAVLDATLDLAAERSPAGVSLRESARAAGVSQAAPYPHFPDKQTMWPPRRRKVSGCLASSRRADAKRTASGSARRLGGRVRAVRCRAPGAFPPDVGAGRPPKASTPSLQDAARDTFQAFFRIVSITAPWKLRQAELREVALELWSIAHGMATLALDGQTLFLSVARDRIHQVARRAAETYLKGLKTVHSR